MFYIYIISNIKNQGILLDFKYFIEREENKKTFFEYI
jgi:hypothetical protein